MPDYMPLNELGEVGIEAAHLQPCCLGLNFSVRIQGFSALARMPFSTPVQCILNARLMKNPLKQDVRSSAACWGRFAVRGQPRS